ncbi:3-hydroxyacyl-CoA dehydrogenase NAD-binding domain-containing protein [Pikeienuella sp. HZG-20]|uniref:3-hydroxyacyl-CoA dehydrogenase NAD-binding domain-containing protein n=1 Tax=Paludibacillus litoralis TaxID=3133267 RepID=UPI0030EF67AC
MGAESEDIRYEKDADGIVTLTLDMAGQSANTMNARYVPAMDRVLARLRAEEGLTGVVFASAKKTFFAGGDLNILGSMTRADAETLRYVEENKRPYREIEKLPVPVVAAINGAALGGGYELCLACNRRIVVDDAKAVVGLPEVTLGLLPGAGGVVRLTALLGLERALPLLLEGKAHGPAKALKLGLVDEIVAERADLIPAAKAWIKANPGAHQQPWDAKGFVYPGGGATSPNVRLAAQVAPAMLVKKTRGLSPAPEKILDIAVNSMRMAFDAALRVESRGLVALMMTPECKAAIQTFFFGMQAMKAGKARPEGEVWAPKSIAILGAGMMGAGIAWANASAGLRTALKDVDLDAASKGKAYSAGLADKRIARGAMDADGKAALLARIRPTADDADLDGADLIIEAVFEDVALKETVIAATFGRLGEGGVYASNTSTLPISLLAESCPEPARFIGLHFFSPVEKMKVVEIILGEKTTEATLRKGYDYVRRIGYMPIVVRDSRGFFTSRVFGTYLDEGQALLIDGMSPAAIERAAWRAGMPIGPLAVHDEVSMVLSKKVHDTHLALDERLGVENGFPADASHTAAVAHRMVEMGRGGRKYGGGFYDYPPEGGKTLWPGLAEFATGNRGVTMKEAEDRLIYRQVVETLRCLDEGVLRTEFEANLGGIFAIGFPAHTGGAIQFVRGIGIEAFKARAAELAETYGERFKVKPSALERLRAA